MDSAHRTIVAFAADPRTGLYDLVCKAFREAHIPWEDCARSIVGAGVVVVIPLGVPQIRVFDRLPHCVDARLRRHNRTREPAARMRMRMAVHAGDIRDGESVAFAGKLLDAAEPADRLTCVVSDDVRPAAPTELPRLVDLLADIPELDTVDGRDQVISLLPREMCTAIRRRQAPRTDLASIVTACRRYPDGMRRLVDAVRFVAAGTHAKVALDDLVSAVARP